MSDEEAGIRDQPSTSLGSRARGRAGLPFRVNTASDRPGSPGPRTAGLAASPSSLRRSVAPSLFRLHFPFPNVID